MQNNNNSRNSNRRKRNRSRKQKDLGKAAEDAQRGVANLKRRSRARAPNQIDAVGTFENPKQVSYKNSNSQLSTVNQKLMSSYCRQYFDYLATVAHPWHVTNAMIPDWTTFPRGTAQVRTVGTITTGNNPGDDTFVLTLIPCLRKSGTLDTTGAVGLSTYITIDGVKYGHGQASTIFSVHNIGTWDTALDSYRVVSMGVRLNYIGQVLNTAGQVVCACMPPESTVATTYDLIADYNYSYVGKAAKGVVQVLLTSGMQSYDMIDIGDTLSTDDRSFIQVSFKGLPLNSAVLECEWVMNIETYATSQILTANAKAGKPDAGKMSVAQSAMAASHAAGKLNGPSSAALNIGKSALQTGAKFAAPMARRYAESLEPGFYQTLARGATKLLENPEILSEAVEVGAMLV